MKLLKQLGIIFAICWLSEVIESVLPFPFPASVIGLIIVLLLLGLKIMKPEHIEESSDYLLNNMSFLFVPTGVGLINYFDLLKSNLFQFIVICVVSTILTFAVTSYSMRFTMKLLNRRKNNDGTI